MTSWSLLVKYNVLFNKFLFGTESDKDFDITLFKYTLCLYSKENQFLTELFILMHFLSFFDITLF